MGVKTKQDTFVAVGSNGVSPSLDAHYGLWNSVSEYETWLTDTVGSSTIPEGVTIAVKGNNKITKYVRENNAWRVDGGEQQTVTKASLGLGNVDNTSDANKPISTAVQSALNLKANSADMTSALALKANSAEMTSALALKADKSQITTAENAATSAAASATRAESAATNAATSAASVAVNSTAIADALDEIKGSDDIPAATIAKVAENSGNISELEQKVTNEDLLLHTKHLYRSSFLDSGYINLSNGVIKTDQTGYVNTGYVEIDRTKKIIYKGDSSNEYLNVLAYYDSNKSFISGVSNIDAKGNETIHVVELDAIPSNARYVVVCAKYTDKYAFFSVPVTTKYLQQQVDEVSLQLVRVDGISSIGCNKKLEITFASAWNDVDVFIPKGAVITSIEDDLVLFSNYPVKGENGKITKSRCPYEVADDITLIRASVAGTHTLYFDDLEVEQLKTEVAELKELVNEGREEVHAKSEFTITGCLNVNGNAVQESATGYITTDYIPIPNNCTKIEVMSGSHNQFNVSGFAIYSATKEVTKRVSGQEPYNYDSFVDEYVPTSADKFIRASGQSSGDCYIKFRLNPNGNSGTITVEDKKLIASSESMTGTQQLSVGVLNVQSHSYTIFRANVSSFSGLKIGNANSYNWYGSWLEIDGSTVKQYYYIGENKLANTMSHGLTITGDVYVCIEHKDGWNAHLVIATKGNVFETDITNWYGCAGECFAQSNGSSFSNCKLSWTCDGFNKDILVVGDSYLGWNKNRFNGWLQSWGYDVNALWDGYPGKPSNLDTIKTYLSLYTPKYIVYALGMNSKDNADSATTAAAPNATWKSNVDELKTLCQSKGIELVLCTIPSANGGADVTQDSGISGFRYNGAKNAYVKSSGLRYIDFASAVNANDTTGNWNTGMLSSDGVHPTTQGALMLAMQMLSDFPEIARK